jgi:uncharacterized membrane protein (DUF2068 family)
MFQDSRVRHSSVLERRDMNGRPQKAPFTLRTIALLEAAKGLLAAAAGFGLISLRHTDLHSAVDAFLVRHGIDPETHYRKLFIESVARATHQHEAQIVAVAFVYALLRFAEAYGLWREKHWAEWFAVISAGLYMPLEIAHLLRRPTELAVGITLFNIAIILYLGRLLKQQRARRKARRQSNQPLSRP